MADAIEYAKEWLARRTFNKREHLLRFLHGGNLVEVDAMGPPAAEPPPQSSGRPVLGNKLLLGHPVYRRPGTGMVVGPSDDVLTARPSSHALTFAPAGSGKASALAIPNLLNFTGSAVVVDIKGELLAATALRRMVDFGHEIFVLDPWGVAETSFWEHWERRWPGLFKLDDSMRSVKCNPLAGLDGDHPDFMRVAGDIAAGIFPDRPNVHNPFFAKNSQGYGVRLMQAVCDGHVGRHINGRYARMPRTLITMRRLIEQRKAGVRQIIERCKDVDERLADQLGAYIVGSDSAEDTISTAETETQFLTHPALETFLDPLPGDREFKFSWLRDPNRKMTVYIVLPTDMLGTQGAFIRIMLQRAIREAVRNPREEKTLVLIDEAGSIGRLDMLPEIYALGRGAGICAWTFFQDVGQCEDDYGTRFSTMEANSEVIQVFRCFDNKTAKHFAEKLGRHERLQTSTSSSTNHGRDGATTTNSTSYSWHQEAYLDAAELEQVNQVLIGNFIKERNGGFYWAGPMDYYMVPYFNGKYRPHPLKPFLGDAPWRPEMTVAEFAAWRRGYVR